MNNNLLIDKPALYFISIITSALHTQRFQKSSGACGTPERIQKKNTMKERLYIHLYLYTNLTAFTQKEHNIWQPMTTQKLQKYKTHLSIFIEYYNMDLLH